MTGLYDTDIRLDEDGQLTQAADGGAPLCSGMDCFLQSIILEAQTQKGELFYDEDFGWSLYDFLQSEDDEITRLEITQRVRSGLLKREEIIPDSVQVQVGLIKTLFIFTALSRPRTRRRPTVCTLSSTRSIWR